jgi:TP901 family phage tail tape measure protein
LGRTLGFVAAGAVAMASGMALVNTAMGAVDVAANYEESAAHLQGLMNVSREGIAEYEDAAFRLARTSRFTSEEVMDAFWQVISAGYSGAQALEIIEPALQGAVMGNLEAADSVKMLGATLHSFGMPAEDAQYALDQLTTTVRLSMTQFDEINTSVSMFGGMMNTLGQDLATGMSIYGVIRNTGMEASRAATNVKMLSSRLIDLHENGVERWAGISLVGPTGEMRDILDVIEELSDAMPKIDEAVFQGLVESEEAMQSYVEQNLSAQLDLYGRRAVIGAFAIANAQAEINGVTLEGIDAVRAMREEIRNSEGAAQSYYDVLMETWNEQKRVLESMKQEIMLQIGLPLLESLKPILEWIVQAMQSVGEFLTTHPEIAVAIGKVALIGGALLTAAGLVILLAGLGAIIAKIGAVILFTAKILGIVLIAVAAIGAAAYWVKNNWEVVKAFFADLANWFWGKFGFIIKAIVGLALIIYEVVLKPIWWFIKNILVPIFAVALGAVSAIIGAILIGLDVIWGVIQSVVAAIEFLFTGDMTAWDTKMEEVWGGIKEEIKVLGDLFFTTILEAIRNIADEVSGGYFTRFEEAGEVGAGRGLLGPEMGQIGGYWDAMWGVDQFTPQSNASGTTRVPRDMLTMVHEDEEIIQRGGRSNRGGSNSPLVGAVNFYSYGKEDPEEFANRAYSQFMRRMADDREAVVGV